MKGLVGMGLAFSVALLISDAAQAATSGSDGPGGTVTVGASDGGSSPGAPGSTGGGGTGPGSSPYACTYLKLVLNDEGGIAPGGPTPGSWYSVTCIDRRSGASTTQTEWISYPSAASTPGIDPHALALQAEKSLQLPSPTSRFNPSGTSTVNLSTWLWIDAAIWHPYSVTVTVGSVGATATAIPVSVAWSMGDGTVTSCGGPGTPFDTTQPSSRQTARCDYIYSRSSAGQPATDGNPNDGAFVVTATVIWSVSWTAQGAVGGGNLPALFTSRSAQMRVEQVESINAGPSGLVRRTILAQGLVP